MKKNCENCKHLEWGFGDENDPQGWVCNKKEYASQKEEGKHLIRLSNIKYRNKGKICFESKGD